LPSRRSAFPPITMSMKKSNVLAIPVSFRCAMDL
jgi:hypothetical protein